MNNSTKIVLVDDHALLRNGLATLVTNLGYCVMYECSNGQQLIDKIDKKDLPDLILMDINMPIMDGFATAQWIRENLPLSKVLVLSMFDDEKSIIKMLRYGVRRGGNVILLDEPTNDLDVDTLRALEEGLSNFGGCAIVTSHDRWFLDRIATHILAFEGDSQTYWFEGNYKMYEIQKHERLGAAADQPHRIKYRPLAR